MRELEDLKVLGIAFLGIIVSYIKIDPLNGLRYVVLFVTLAYTLYKFWHEVKKNKKNK